MKAIDEAGIPIVHVCTIVPISKAVGANRIYPAVAIPHPTGYPEETPEKEKELRYELTKKALQALTTDIQEQTVFSVR